MGLDDAELLLPTFLLAPVEDPAEPLPPLVDHIVTALHRTGLRPAISDLFAPEVEGIATASEITPSLVHSIVDHALAPLED